MSKIEWFDIPGYEGIYQINKNSDITSFNKRQQKRLTYVVDGRKCLKHVITKVRHPRKKVSLYYGGVRKIVPVHTLMAITFLDLENNKHLVVDHINNDAMDNRLCNLQLITIRENSSKDKKPASGYTGVRRLKYGTFSAKIDETVDGVKNQYYLGTFKTAEEASNEYQRVLKLINNKTFNYEQHKKERNERRKNK